MNPRLPYYINILLHFWSEKGKRLTYTCLIVSTKISSKAHSLINVDKDMKLKSYRSALIYADTKW